VDVDTVQVPALSADVQFEQKADGWWWLNGHPILRVDLEAQFVHIAANCPYRVDLELNWLQSLIHPMGESQGQASVPVSKGWTKRLGQIGFYVLGALAWLLLLSFPFVVMAVQCGVIRIAE
jgi:hypothetical protein